MHPNRLRGYPNPIKRNPDKAQEMKKRGMGGREMKGARELLLSTWDSFQDGKHRPLVRRLPNVKLKRFDYSLTTSADGLFYLRPPYPPRINRTIECEPPGKAKKNPWPTTVHKDYKLKWKNIEYIFVPELTRKPHGTPQRRWTGPVTRVEHREGKAKVTMVTHDDEILHDCAYVQHEIDRVRAEKSKTVDDRNKMEEVARATADRLRADIRDALTMKADSETQIYKTKRRQQEQEEENARLRTYLSKCKEDLDRALR
ncbi:Uncharacterized protein SCF082_LOCUS10552 [Durusdinium trenchii]|uniref:Uncharacterized protein n=1 Tax=Durusdinium trenchii TaxID=1381693 RepID=A0ABP0J716_9DINO